MGQRQSEVLLAANVEQGRRVVVSLGVCPQVVVLEGVVED